MTLFGTEDFCMSTLCLQWLKREIGHQRNVLRREVKWWWEYCTNKSVWFAPIRKELFFRRFPFKLERFLYDLFSSNGIKLLWHSGRKKLSWIQHGTSVTRPFIRCISTMVDFRAVWCQVGRRLLGTLDAQKREKRTSSHKQLLWQWAFWCFRPFAKRDWKWLSRRDITISTWVNLGRTTSSFKNFNGYGIQYIRTWTAHNLHPRIHNLLKQFTFKPLGMNGETTHYAAPVKHI